MARALLVLWPLLSLLSVVSLLPTRQQQVMLAMTRDNEYDLPGNLRKWYSDIYDVIPDEVRSLAHPEDTRSQQNGLYNDVHATSREERYMAPEAALLTEDVDWPAPNININIGEVGGVAVDTENNVHMFHRANHTWGPGTFDENNKFTGQAGGPIRKPALVTLAAYDGARIRELGRDRFFMPHGLTLDHDGYYWLTDVALHQVMKYCPKKDQPVLTLGEAFTPAKDDKDEARFCKPTDVAPSTKGIVFIADGYCNSRIVVVSDNGTFLGSFGGGNMIVPHSLALLEDRDILAVADRENERILLFNAGLEDESMRGQLEMEVSFPDLGRVYAITYAQMEGLLFVVSESHSSGEAFGYTVNLQNLDDPYFVEWTPNDKSFSMPHDIATSEDGRLAYVGFVDPALSHKVWRFYSN